MDNKKLKETLGKIYDELSGEQKEKALKCETENELIAFMNEEGIGLPDDMLDEVSGGNYTARIKKTDLRMTGETDVSYAEQFKNTNATFGQTIYNTDTKKFKK